MMRALLLACGLLAAAPPADAACRMALALALDVSSSVDATEYSLQAEGLAGALEDPEVIEALLGGGSSVALAVYEWSGQGKSWLVADWKVMASPTDVFALAATVRTARRSASQYPTALGRALDDGRDLLARNPGCGRLVIDVSGDGANNDGPEPAAVTRQASFEGVTVNALVVGGVNRPALVRYFQTLVIHGPNAFTEVAADYADYGRAMKRKLLKELRPLVVGDLPAGAPVRVADTAAEARR